MCSADLFLGLLAILFPPLPVWVKTGLCSADSIINILLCLLGYLPGTIHAWYIISKFPESYEYEAVPQDSESARVTYIFVQEPQPQARPQAHPKSASNSQPNYGATDNSSNHHNNNASSSSAGPSDAHDDEGHAPPTYAEAVKGDHKIQTHD